MILTRYELLSRIKIWLKAWDQHDIDGVMELMHEDTVFENWTGQVINGKQALRNAWVPWFLKHGNFIFIVEDIFVDESTQKAVFRWRLEWPSPEPAYKGKQEIRRGVDVLYFLDGKIREKLTYSKTTLFIEGRATPLIAKN